MEQKFDKYYQLLGLQSGANSTDIKKKFKELAFKYHPDRNPHNAFMEARFREVVEAYAYLSGNQETLRALQNQSKAEPKSEQVHSYQDFIAKLFEQEIRSAELTQDPIAILLTLNLREALSGCRKKITFARKNFCLLCNGTGIEKGNETKVQTCNYCMGFGDLLLDPVPTQPKPCPKCNGRGFISAYGCLACEARGVLLKNKTIYLTIPAKVFSGQIITIANEGNEFAWAKRSDVHVKIALSSSHGFTFDGTNLICKVKSFLQKLFGVKHAK